MENEAESISQILLMVTRRLDMIINKLDSKNEIGSEVKKEDMEKEETRIEDIQYLQSNVTEKDVAMQVSNNTPSKLSKRKRNPKHLKIKANRLKPSTHQWTRIVKVNKNQFNTILTQQAETGKKSNEASFGLELKRILEFTNCKRKKWIEEQIVYYERGKGIFH